MLRVSNSVFVASVVVFSAIILMNRPTFARPLHEYIDQAELFERVLAQVDLKPEDVNVDSGDLAYFSGDRYKLKIVDSFFSNPWRISDYTRFMTDQMLKDSADIGALTTSAHKKLDCGVRLGLLGDTLEPYRNRITEHGDEALAIALAELDLKFYSSDGLLSASSINPPDNELDYRKYMTSEYKRVPRAVRDAAALYLFALPEIARYYNLGLVDPLEKLGLDIGDTKYKVLDYAVTTFEEEIDTAAGEEDEDSETVLLIESLLDNTDWNLLNTGATLFAITNREMEKMLAEADPKSLDVEFEYTVPTLLGTLALSGKGDQGYFITNQILIIDTGGDDMYRIVNTDVITHQPFSTIIDLEGGDDYRSSAEVSIDFKKVNDTKLKRVDIPLPSLGAGFFGYGALIDSGGNDKYDADYASLGFGCFGTGILWDKEGNDIYQGIRDTQGCGVFGTGILSDNAGDDYYELYTYGQGYGYTKGCGYLVDLAGNDRYIGKRDRNPNGGPFGAERFIHFAQGAAYGRRADFTDGHSWAGGFGALADGGGNDEYQSEVYSQGTGYWYAIGMCVDKGGNDFHHAGWYSLGGSPHFAIGIMQDDSGDDRYALWQQQGIGNGRDFSIGWFEDSAGDDWYFGGILAFGTGDINGLGFFWDKLGNDVYITKGTCLGQARLENTGSVRDLMLTLGCFVDGGGKDRYLIMPGDTAGSGVPKPIPPDIDWQNYPAFDFAFDGKAWTRETEQFQTAGARGCGIDSE